MVPEDTGKLVIVDAATLDGNTITLPGAVAGREIEFVLEADSTTAFFIEAANGDNFFGRVILTDGTSTKVDRETKATSNSGNVDKLRIDSNATNTGGQVGDRFTCRAVDAQYWLVSAELTSSGTITQAGGFFTTTTPS